MKFALTILGTSAATPAFGRHPSAQLLQAGNQHFLVDCGEGTQLRLQTYGLPAQRINNIFISHLHGDHIFGLPGLLFSLSLLGRQAPLDVFAPPGLSNMVAALLAPGGRLGYAVRFPGWDHTMPTPVYADRFLTVTALPLLHRIPTVGYVFREKERARNILPDAIDRYGLDIPQIKSLKAGQDLLLADGRLIPNAELTVAGVHARSYAYLSDTAYTTSVLPHIRAVDLLYHETTFCEDCRDQADSTGHSTAAQAADIARQAGAGTLVTGHYSPRYRHPAPFLAEAQAIFPDTLAGLEGYEYEIPWTAGGKNVLVSKRPVQEGWCG
jgi:ribonuclease Z